MDIDTHICACLIPLFLASCGNFQGLLCEIGRHSVPALVSRIFTESIRCRQTAVLRCLGFLARSEGFCPLYRPRQKLRMGGLRQAALCGTRAGARLCGPLYPPRGPLQQPAAGYRKRPGPFPVEELSGQRPHPNDDFIGRRVHPAVLTACVAERFPTHSLLRFSGKSLPVTETCPVSPLTRHADAKTQTPLPRRSGTTATTTNASPVVRRGSVRNACAVTW